MGIKVTTGVSVRRPSVPIPTDTPCRADTKLVSSSFVTIRLNPGCYSPHVCGLVGYLISVAQVEQSTSEGEMFQRLVVLLVACVIFGAGRPAAAQLTTADIVGTVTDTTGGVVPGATVTITNTATEVTQVVVTDRVGNYVVNLLPPGRYRVL